MINIVNTKANDLYYYNSKNIVHLVNHDLKMV